MVKGPIEKKRRLRIDPGNPYRTRDLVYHLRKSGESYYIEVEQRDYVLHSQVAEIKGEPLELETEEVARQLIEYLLVKARSKKDAVRIYHDWRTGKVPRLRSTKDILVREAIQRRFSRNLKRI